MLIKLPLVLFKENKTTLLMLCSLWLKRRKLIAHIYYIILYYISHLSCNKSAKFLVLNVYFEEENHGEEEEDDPKFSWLNSVFGELGS